MGIKDLTTLSLLLVFSIFAFVMLSADFPTDEKIATMVTTTK